MLLGAAEFTYINSQASNLVGELNEVSPHQPCAMDTLTHIVTYPQILGDLVYGVRWYLPRQHAQPRIADEKQLLDSINRHLRIKVLEHVYGPHVEPPRLFRDVPSSHLDDVYDNLVERSVRKYEVYSGEEKAISCASTSSSRGLCSCTSPEVAGATRRPREPPQIGSPTTTSTTWLT